MRSLFLTYDGLLSPLGQSQILPYLRGLQRRGHQVSILSFEQGKNADPSAQSALRAELAGEGLSWFARRYHKRPTAPATSYDILTGAATARGIVARQGIEVLHARSYIPLLMALLVAGPRKVLFDMRGFWADERVDGKLWDPARTVPRTMYKLAKGLERWGLRRADHVVVLTHAGARVMPEIPGVTSPLPPISVIPTCVDLERFRPLPDVAARAARRRELGLPESAPILLYQGSIGTWYMLPEMVAFVKQAKRRWPDLLWLVLAPSEHELFRRQCAEAGLVEGRDYRLEALSHKQVPRWLPAADASLFFIRPTYSKLSSCPTKFGECLACGIPVVANTGVGDVGETISRHQVGVAVSHFDEPAYEQAMLGLERLLADPETAVRCRAAAEADFALANAVESYDSIYRSFESRASAPAGSASATQR